MLLEGRLESHKLDLLLVGYLCLCLYGSYWSIGLSCKSPEVVLLCGSLQALGKANFDCCLDLCALRFEREAPRMRLAEATSFSYKGPSKTHHQNQGPFQGRLRAMKSYTELLGAVRALL